ncbi:MAG TPA: hypothetical protein VMV46_03180 [Thermoanaerobaculia bacterium]|nr:hypothetical protein [Thermoanaerobaculia bacterium]
MRPRPFPELLDEAVLLARRRPLSVVWRIGVPLAVVNAGWAAITSWFVTGAFATADPNLLFGALGAMFAALPLFFAAQLVAYAALAVAATGRALGREMGLRESLRFVFRLRTLGTLALVAFLLVGSIVLLVFPFFVVSALVSFLYPVMIDEARFGMTAVSRSSSLAWRNPRGLLQTWPLLLVMTIHAVFFAISTGLSLAVQAPFQVVQQVVTFRQALGGAAADPTELMSLMWLQVPLGIVTTFTSLLAAWYLFVCLAIVFRDVRERREATTLARRIEGWTAAPSTGAEP